MNNNNTNVNSQSSGTRSNSSYQSNSHSQSNRQGSGPNRRPTSSSPYRGGGNQNRQGGGQHRHGNRSNLSPQKRQAMRQPSLRSTIRQIRMNKTAGREPSSDLPIPALAEGDIRFIPLGGVEEIGKNITAIEIGNDIIIIDAGFQFKTDSTPGIDYILPNTKYLEERKDRIRGLFITHGHLDHIGGIPYILEKIGNPKIYSRQFGSIMIKKKMEDFPHLPKPDITILDGDETINVGSFKIETFPISHTIPDSMGLIINTHLGDIVFIEDVRVDNIEGVPTDEEVEQYKRFKDRNVLMLTLDSTSVEKRGFSISENVVVENIEKIIKDVSSRLIIATFASQVERIIAIIELSAKYGKKVFIEGRSMKSNLEIIKHLKLVDTSNILPLSELENTAPDKIVMLVTGAQGEEFAALMRIANKTHKHIKLRESDTVLLSSSIIPTNHESVVSLKDRLYRSPAKIITYLDSDVHASGHGNREELKWIHEQIPYKYFIPLHGNHFMLKIHAELAESIGVPKENIIVPDNGAIIEIQDGGKKFVRLPMSAPNEVMTVDGFAVGEIQDVVLDDRKLLSEAGIFVIVASINTRTGKLKKSPDIISRGFVYLRESQDLLRRSRFLIRKTLEDHMERNKGPVDFDKMKKRLADDVSKFLLQETAKQPLVISVLLGV